MWDGLRPGSTHYFELWAADEWVNNISTVPATQSAWCPVMTIPALTGLTVGRTVGVALSTSATATFTKPMDLASMSMAGAVSWTLVKDHLGVSTNAAMGFTVSSNTAGNVITIAPTAPLAGNGTYVVTVTTAAKDVFGMNLSTSTTIRFTTILDLADHNVITEGLCGATIDVSSGSLPVNGYFTGTGLSPSDVAGATDKLVSATGDSLRRPLPGSVVNFVFNDAAGTPQSTLAAPFQIALSYSPDASRPGFIDGSQARVKTLAVYWLDAAHNLWVKSPSALDPAACTVRAPVPRFATFALMAQADTDLSAAYAFPSPFIASKSSDGKIWFTGLGQSGTIRIYTSEGRLVRELSIEGGTEQWAWDVRNDSGEPVASGLYSYVIKNDKESKTGRLAVIR
jgi:hypothetical protein